MAQKVYCFDFDGTLTTRDTLLCFIRHAVGTPRFVAGFALFGPLLVLMKLGLYPNWKAKQRVFAHFFGGWTAARFQAACDAFAASSRHLLRPCGQAAMAQARAEGARIIVVSASMEAWVKPFLPTAEVLGTKIETADGRLTGRFLSANCYGEEKVNRLKAVLTEPRTHYYIIAFGDSRGDKELLAYADEAHFKPFR